MGRERSLSHAIHRTFMMYNVHHHIVFSGSRTQKIGEEGGIGKRSEKIVGTVLKGQGKGGNQSGEEGKAVAGGGDATGACAPPF